GGGEARGRSRRFRETGAAGDRASPSVHATGLGARPGHVTVLGVRVQHLNIGIIFPWVYITTIILYPGASIWLGIFITGIFTGFLAVVYAGLASAMPRTGGDYVFQSRTLRPWLGFAIVSTMIITFFLQWQALGG